MPVQHTFKTVGGKLKTRNLTPLSAIREACIHCCQGVHAVRDCGGETCPLYPFRMGRRCSSRPSRNRRKTGRSSSEIGSLPLGSTRRPRERRR